MERERTKYPGVYQRTAETRKHKGRADVCFDITFKREGKKIWEKVGWISEGYSAQVASEIRANRIRNVRHGEELPKDKKKAPFFKDVAKEYLKWAAKNKTREGRDDEIRYRKYLSSPFDDKRLNQISSLDLERLKNKIIKDGLSAGSAKHCLVLFRQIFNKAALWNMYEGKNPIKGVKLPTLQNQRERFLSHEEASILLNELRVDQSRKKNPGEKKDPQLHDMALLSLHCGLRAGEIFNLKGQDLDFDNALINISDPKNKESRKAFMTEAVKEVLSSRVPKSPDEYVFKERRGKRTEDGKNRKDDEKINQLSAVFGKTVNRLGFNDGVIDPRQKITFHSLRHTFASWLALQGETILTIKELLGHKSLAMTTRYAHLMPEHKRQATMNLEKAFNANRGEAHGNKG
jgi:integrase